MPKTKAQNEIIREQSKEKILYAALKAFSRYGYHGTTMRMIAMQAKISKGLIYNYFLNKKEIMEFLLEQRVAQIKKIFNQEIIGTPEERIDFAIREFCDNIVKNEGVIRLLISIFVQPGVRLALNQEKKFEHKLLKDFDTYFEDVRKKLDHSQKKWTKETIITMFYGLVMTYLLDEDELKFRSTSRDLFNLVFK